MSRFARWTAALSAVAALAAAPSLAVASVAVGEVPAAAPATPGSVTLGPVAFASTWLTLAQAAPAEPSTGLPQRPAQPRTMRDYWHVFIAFAITWLLLFGYALSLGRRFSRLEAEVRRLRT
jgi:CcmD family protein